MSLSLAEVDFSRLSPSARRALEEIALPLQEGVTVEELAERLGVTRREINEARSELAWEIRAQVHGAEVRDATAEEDEALRQSIREHGQLVPVLVDRAGRIVAGHRRARICEELGLELQTLTVATDDGHDVKLAENLVRRHLTPSDRRRMISAELVRDPERSDRSIASVFGVSPTTVGVVRQELEREGQVSRLDTRRGKDGKQQPASKPDRLLDPDPQSRLDYIDQELLSLAALEDRERAHARADELLLEALRMLGGERIADAWEQSGKRWYA